MGRATKRVSGVNLQRGLDLIATLIQHLGGTGFSKSKFLVIDISYIIEVLTFGELVGGLIHPTTLA